MIEERITVNPAVMGGRPCIRGLRFPVSRPLGLMAGGQTEREILHHHPDLEPDDLRAAMEYAAARADDRVIVLKSAWDSSSTSR